MHVNFHASSYRTVLIVKNDFQNVEDRGNSLLRLFSDPLFILLQEFKAEIIFETKLVKN